MKKNAGEVPARVLSRPAAVYGTWAAKGSGYYYQSLGGFLLGVTAENIHASCVRGNELLADLMQRGDLIEKAGTGIARMREECEAHGTPPPEIEDIGHLVTVTFTPHPKAVR